MVRNWLMLSWHETKRAEDEIKKGYRPDIRTAVRESRFPSYYELEVETEFPEEMAHVEDIIAKFM